VTDQKALEYLESFQNIPAVDLQTKFPAAPVEAIDFLKKTLVFNPFFRMSLEEAINHPMFDKLKGSLPEMFCGSDISLEFEGENLDQNSLRNLVFKEIQNWSK